MSQSKKKLQSLKTIYENEDHREKKTSNARQKNDDSKVMTVRDMCYSVDTIHVKVVSLRLPEANPPLYHVKASFFDQLVLSEVLQPLGICDASDPTAIVARGTLSYDPSDYVKMSIFADTPLTVSIQTVSSLPSNYGVPVSSPSEAGVKGRALNWGKDGGRSNTRGMEFATAKDETPRDLSNLKHISTCNIDILPLFLGQEKMCVKKRLEPMVARKVMERKSWDNLPLITLSMFVSRDKENRTHHQLFRDANAMKITMIGAFNMLTPYDIDQYYTVATKVPAQNQDHVETQIFQEGIYCPRKFNPTKFYPRWESLKQVQSLFLKGDDKMTYDVSDVHNPDDFDLQMYFNEPQTNTAIWGTFHRSLLLGDQQQWIWNHLKSWKWPLELHHYGEYVGGHSFMGFMDLFPMLYPGVQRLVLAVPLIWFEPAQMEMRTGFPIMMAPQASEPGGQQYKKARSDKFKITPSSASAGSSVADVSCFQTGVDGCPAFVMIAVEFLRPLIPIMRPNYITPEEINEMLAKMAPGQGKRHCIGRGQLTPAWTRTVTMASNSLHKVPYHGIKDFCSFDRQLAVTRTRVEILASFVLQAALFVNNNFNIHDFLQDEDTYEQLLRLAHACMMDITINTLIVNNDKKIDTVLRAARHARQLFDITHALELYLQAVVANPYNAKYWRELSTCLKDVDLEWAAVCLNKSLTLETRNPISLLSKACMVFEEKGNAAYCFFKALILLFPLWPLAYIICNAYCTAIENYRIADVAMESYRIIQEERIGLELPKRIGWERELGDFWEPTVFLPGSSPFFLAADLLLRVRGVRLAEVCLSIGLSKSGESPEYFHLAALCFFLRGQYEDAICLLDKGIEMFGQNTYLRCLEGHCRHQLDDIVGSLAAYEKVSGGTSAHSILMSLPFCEKPRVRGVLVDLLRRQPSAYAWMALARDWLPKVEEDRTTATQEEQTALACAGACAMQALKCDRRAGQGWAMLAKLVHPSKRRQFCYSMADDCEYDWDSAPQELKDFYRRPTHESATYLLGKYPTPCVCEMCEPLRM